MKLLIALIFLLVGSSSSFAASELDHRYGFDKWAVIVVNREAEPVYGDQVQAALAEWIDRSLRFQWVTDSELAFKESFSGGPAPTLGSPKQEALGPYRGLLNLWASRGIDGAVLAEIQNRDGAYQLFGVLVIPATGEVVHSAVIPIAAPKQLAAFTAAARDLGEQLASAIPYDGSIVSREGYRVVVNRGHPRLNPNQRLAAYTLEQKGGVLVFIETGTIELTRVERNLAFGTVVVEKDGHTVSAGNKIRVAPADTYASRLPVGTPGINRGPASLFSSEGFQKGELGTLNLDVGASLVTLSLTSAGAAASQSRNVVYPGATLQGELWLTSRLFLDLAFQLASATLVTSGSGSEERLNSSLSDFRGLLGYRFLLGPRGLGPTVRLTLGYATHRFTIDPARDPLFFGTANFKGLSLGAGASLPLGDNWGVGADVRALLFPSLDEGPFTSGAQVTSLSAIDFQVKGYYNLTSELDLEAKLLLQGYGAQFSGAGTRPQPLLSSSRSSRLIALGISYYF